MTQKLDTTVIIPCLDREEEMNRVESGGKINMYDTILILQEFGGEHSDKVYFDPEDCRKRNLGSV